MNLKGPKRSVNYAPKFSEDIPLHIKQDIESVSKRTNTFSFDKVLPRDKFSISNRSFQQQDTVQKKEIILNINTHAWSKSRFRDVLPWLAHEYGHIDLEHRIAHKDPMELHQQEFAADAQFAIKTGIAKDAALEHWRENELAGITHPDSMSRANRLFKLHRNNLYNPEYLDSRFWKLGFVLNSYKNQIMFCKNFCGAFPERCLQSNGYWCCRLPQKKVHQLLCRMGTLSLLKKIINHKVTITKYLDDDLDQLEENGFEESITSNDVILSKMPNYDYILFAHELKACAKILEQLVNKKE